MQKPDRREEIFFACTSSPPSGITLVIPHSLLTTTHLFQLLGDGWSFFTKKINHGKSTRVLCLHPQIGGFGQALYVHTQDLKERFPRHNENRERATKNLGPCKVISHESLPSRAEAMKRVKNFKTYTGWKWLKLESIIYEKVSNARVVDWVAKGTYLGLANLLIQCLRKCHRKPGLNSPLDRFILSKP